MSPKAQGTTQRPQRPTKVERKLAVALWKITQREFAQGGTMPSYWEGEPFAAQPPKFKAWWYATARETIRQVRKAGSGG